MLIIFIAFSFTHLVSGVVYVQDQCSHTNPIDVKLSLHFGTVILESQSGSSYAGGRQCTLFVEGSWGYKLRVKVERFDLYGSRGTCMLLGDNVRIYDALKGNASRDFPLTDYMCGNLTGYPPIYSYTNIIHIDFFANYAYGKRSGFRFIISEIDEYDLSLPVYMETVCKENNPYHVLDKRSGYVYSNNGPALYYHGNLDCGVIITVSRNLTLAFTIERLNIRDSRCEYGDFVRIYGGASTAGTALTSYLCGYNNKHSTTYTKLNQIFLRFHTYGTGLIPYTGFDLRYFTFTEEPSQDINVGAIIGGVGGVVVIAVHLIILFCLFDTRCPMNADYRRQREQRRSHNSQVAPSNENTSRNARTTLTRTQPSQSLSVQEASVATQLLAPPAATRRDPATASQHVPSPGTTRTIPIAPPSTTMRIPTTVPQPVPLPTTTGIIPTAPPPVTMGITPPDDATSRRDHTDAQPPPQYPHYSNEPPPTYATLFPDRT